MRVPIKFSCAPFRILKYFNAEISSVVILLNCIYRTQFLCHLQEALAVVAAVAAAVVAAVKVPGNVNGRQKRRFSRHGKTTKTRRIEIHQWRRLRVTKIHSEKFSFEENSFTKTSDVREESRQLKITTVRANWFGVVDSARFAPLRPIRDDRVRAERRRIKMQIV